MLDVAQDVFTWRHKTINTGQYCNWIPGPTQIDILNLTYHESVIFLGRMHIERVGGDYPEGNRGQQRSLFELLQYLSDHVEVHGRKRILGHALQRDHLKTFTPLFCQGSHHSFQSFAKEINKKTQRKHCFIITPQH